MDVDDADLRARFAAVATMEPPDLWPGIVAAAASADAPRRGLRLPLVAAMAAVTAVALVAALLVRDDDPAPDPVVTATEPPTTVTTTPGATTTTAAPVTTVPTTPGAWETVDVPVPPRQGAASTMGAGRLFVWGGRDRDGVLRDDGYVVDLVTGATSPIPAGPLAARELPAVAWTGSELLVVGGYPDRESYVDGAAFDPAAGTWRSIPDLPFTQGAYPAAHWTGDELVVWLPVVDRALGVFLPVAGPGQVAAYDPGTDAWRAFEGPGFPAIGATFVTAGETTYLVGGPPLRDVGSISTDLPVVASELQVASGTFGDPVETYPTDVARAFAWPDGRLGAVTAYGTALALDDGAWVEEAEWAAGCWFDVAVASAPGRTYVRTCGAVDLLDGDGMHRILAAGAPGSTIDTYTSAFLVDETGRLVTLGPPDALATTQVLAVFDPDAPPAPAPTAPTTAPGVDDRIDASLTSLRQREACGYAAFYARDDANTAILRAVGSTLFHQVEADPGVHTFEVELPSEDVDVELRLGVSVQGFFCTDVTGAERVDVVYRPVAGTAELTLRIGARVFDSRGDLRLRDVVLQPDDGGPPVAIADISWEDVPLGTSVG
jgi:hypothetical protein